VPEATSDAEANCVEQSIITDQATDQWRDLDAHVTAKDKHFKHCLLQLWTVCP